MNISRQTVKQIFSYAAFGAGLFGAVAAASLVVAGAGIGAAAPAKDAALFIVDGAAVGAAIMVGVLSL